MYGIFSSQIDSIRVYNYVSWYFSCVTAGAWLSSTIMWSRSISQGGIGLPFSQWKIGWPGRCTLSYSYYLGQEHTSQWPPWVIGRHCCFSWIYGFQASSLCMIGGGVFPAQSEVLLIFSLYIPFHLISPVTFLAINLPIPSPFLSPIPLVCRSTSPRCSGEPNTTTFSNSALPP